jgi:hypothetical protein
MSTGIYYLKFWESETAKTDDIHDSISGFKKFKLYEPIPKTNS